MGETYKQLIFTDHALQRMQLRSVSKDAIWRVLQHPERTIPSDKPDSTKFIRTINDREYHIIGTYLPDQDKTLIISLWVRGEDDPDSFWWWAITAPFKALWWALKTIYHAWTR